MPIRTVFVAVVLLACVEGGPPPHGGDESHSPSYPPLGATELLEAVEFDLAIWKNCLEGLMRASTCLGVAQPDARIYVPTNSSPLSRNQAIDALGRMLAPVPGNALPTPFRRVELFPRDVMLGNNSIGFTLTATYECGASSALLADQHFVFMRLSPESGRAQHYFDFFDADRARRIVAQCRGSKKLPHVRAQADFAAARRTVERLVEHWNAGAFFAEASDANGTRTGHAAGVLADDVRACYSWWRMEACTTGPAEMAALLAVFAPASSVVLLRNVLLNEGHAWASLTLHALCHDGSHGAFDLEQLYFLGGEVDGGSRLVQRIEFITDQDTWFSFASCVLTPHAHPPRNQSTQPGGQPRRESSSLPGPLPLPFPMPLPVPGARGNATAPTAARAALGKVGGREEDGRAHSEDDRPVPRRLPSISLHLKRALPRLSQARGYTFGSMVDGTVLVPGAVGDDASSEPVYVEAAMLPGSLVCLALLALACGFCALLLAINCVKESALERHMQSAWKEASMAVSHFVGRARPRACTAQARQGCTAFGGGTREPLIA